MISSHIFERAKEYAGLFGQAQPFRHVSIDDFLLPAACQGILDAFPAFNERNAINELGTVGNKAVRTDVGNLDTVYSQLDAKIRSTEFLELISTITGIPDLRYDPDYVGGGTHENRNGQALAPHIDFNILPGRRWHRRLNLIIYLNPAWKEDWGGCIELHSDPWRPSENYTKRFLPSFNRCVIFETNERSWHGFEAIRLPEEHSALTRKSFAIYLYTEQRSAEETVPSHGTVYVPKGMPKAVRQGEILTASAHAELEGRFNQLLYQLKFLYQRELKFSDHVEQLGLALVDASSRAKIDLQGYAVQGEGVRGVWSDGWIGTEMRTSFTPSIAADALNFAAWIPQEMPEPQVLSLKLGNAVKQLTVLPGQVAETAIECPMPAGVPVEFQVSAKSCFQPSKNGGSDERELAWRLAKAMLRHGGARLP